MMNSYKGILPLLFVLFLLLTGACGKSASNSNKNRNVNFAPNTYIDSLYISYLHSDGNKRVSNANALLAAIYEEEEGDSLIQFTTKQDLKTIDPVVNYWMGEIPLLQLPFQRGRERHTTRHAGGRQDGGNTFATVAVSTRPRASHYSPCRRPTTSRMSPLSLSSTPFSD